MFKYLFLLLVSRVHCSDSAAVFKENLNSGGVNNENIATFRSKCICVPYYLCQNNTVITNGVGVIDIRVKTGPCDNYLDVCCEKLVADADRFTPSIPSFESDGCGRHNPDGVGFRITGNENGEAQFGEFPWMVAVLKEEQFGGQKRDSAQCGGSLIHPEVVMTAAHCVNNSHTKFKIRAGEWDTQTRSELFPHQDALVKKVVIHPDYYAGALYNDIALLFLDSPITLADNIDVVCLPKHNLNYYNSRCFASGWGKEDFDGGERFQGILKKVDLPMVPHTQCEKALRQTRLGPHFKLHSSFVCAGGEPNRDTCKGDGGSPLVCQIPGTEDKFAQVGIVSWGIGCGENNTPGVYANVAWLRDWIDEQIFYNGFNAKYYEY